MKTAPSFHWLAGAWRRYRRNERGAATAELACCLALFTYPALMVTELGYYIYQRMEVEVATQSAAQAIWATCSSSSQMPATINCGSAMATARDTAVQSTSLGTKVSVTSTTEDYYCVVGGTLTALGANLNSKKPANCKSVGGSSTDTPGDYVVVTTTFTYSPIFGGLALVSLLPSTITQQAWTRIV